MSNETKYPCPCCGYRTYRLPAGGTMELCPVCFWEDCSDYGYWNGSNSVTLADAQKNFAEFGASEQEFVDSVRLPLPEEERDSNWLSLDQSAHRIIEFIELAYADVKLGDGLTIHQREAIDDYQSGEEIQNVRRLDPEKCWQDIAEDKIERLGTSLTFLDPKSIRYHLPAFMRHALRAWLKMRCFGSTDFVLYALDSGPRSEGYHADSFLLLSSSQNQAVAAFLNFVSIVDSIYGSDAEKGLENGWKDWLPETLLISNNLIN